MSAYSSQTKQIEQLYRKMYSSLYIYAKSALGNASLAEEAVQDAFCIACAKSSEFLHCESPEGWIMTTLKYVVQNAIRQRANMGKLTIMALNSGESAPYAAYDSENIDLLYEDLASREDFQLFKKIALDRYSMQEAADEFGITLESCKKRVQRTRAFLRKKFSQNKK